MFQAPPSSLLERTLRILVYNIDVNRKHRVLGESRLDLNDVDLTQGRLVSMQNKSKEGETSDAMTLIAEVE